MVSLVGYPQKNALISFPEPQWLGTWIDTLPNSQRSEEPKGQMRASALIHQEFSNYKWKKQLNLHFYPR